MSKARSTGNLNNSIVISDTGAITFVSGSTTLATINTTGQISGSTSVLSAATASFVALAQSASNAVSAQTASYANTFTVAGTLTAQTLVVQTVTSSVDFVTGSTRFGSLSSNTHTFTGSILTSGSVGIGTSSPTAKLEIQNSPANDWGLSVWGNTTTGQSYGGIVRGGTNSSDVAFRVNNAVNNTTYFTVNGNGNTGIGTGSPFSRLTIQASGSYSLLTLGDNWASDTFTGIKIGAAADTGLAGVDIRSYSYYASSAATSMAIFTNSTGNVLTERMRITTTGQLNLGTYHEQAKFCPGADSNHYLRYNSSLDGLEMSGYSGVLFSTLGGTERMRIETNGDVKLGVGAGVTDTKFLFISKGSTSSTYSLVIKQSDFSTNLMYVRDDGYGYLKAASWAYGSDRRIKENINYIETGLDKVLQLKPAKFDYIDGIKNNIGWIAQDVQEVIPEAVSTVHKDNDQLTLKTDFIVPYLVKAIQELKVENDTLKEILQRNNIQ